MEKSLDIKLADIHADPVNSKALILADAKDADMAFGITAPGESPEHEDGGFRSLKEYRDNIRRNVQQGLIDIMLMSVSTNELLTIRERLFDASPVTPAIRANDTTDIHVARGASYPKTPARPFRTALLEHAQCGQLGCDDSQRHLGANLGLFSLTFNNDVELDRAMLEAYREFRVEAELKGFRHFLEVFAPNAMVNPIPPKQLGNFMNDMIARALAGVASSGRPLFLKTVYNGPKALEELVNYDPHLVVGVLGGSAGTTYDAFKLLSEAKAYGARAALFGRKINNAEHQLGFIQFLRWIADGEITAEEAVKAYHSVLQGLGIKPHRSLNEDMKLTSGITSYGGSAAMISIPAVARPAAAAVKPTVAKPTGNGNASYPMRQDGLPDFAKMTPQQRLAYHMARLNNLG
ncbi:MAG: hypothetical protein KAU28_10495 [Phycisphaerae bacterium]|nr:hypothetical protein [Phycisphaerae bacterium]